MLWIYFVFQESKWISFIFPWAFSPDFIFYFWFGLDFLPLIQQSNLPHSLARNEPVTKLKCEDELVMSLLSGNVNLTVYDHADR